MLQQLILTYKSTKNESQVIWTEPGLGDKSMSSYLMCQMKWHTVLVTKQGRNITIILDKHLASSGLVIDQGEDINGQLFLGGYPGKILIPLCT